jgi:hypothetical protein
MLGICVLQWFISLFLFFLIVPTFIHAQIQSEINYFGCLCVPMSYEAKSLGICRRSSGITARREAEIKKWT